MGYREDYEKQYKVVLNNDWDIHHIDYDHSNNDMDNLVALPRYLHEKLHKAYNRFTMYKCDFTVSDIRLHSGFCCSHTIFMQTLAEYISVLEECVPFMNMRNFLKMRNINE